MLVNDIKQVCIDTFTKHYYCFDGRTGRRDFWLFFLAMLILNVILGLIGIRAVSTLVALAVLLPGIGITARRLHDTGRSGWWQLLCLTGIGSLIVLLFCALEGTPGHNPYGDPNA